MRVYEGVKPVYLPPSGSVARAIDLDNVDRSAITFDARFLLRPPNRQSAAELQFPGFVSIQRVSLQRQERERNRH
jgi:hypothetical protein